MRLVGLLQHGQAGYVVLHFAEGVQNAVAVRGHAGVVARFSEVHFGAPRSAGEDALGDVGAYCPERTLHIYQLGDIGGLPATVSKQIQGRVVSSAGDSDLCVCHGHLPLGFRNVWPPFQQIRR